MKNRQKSTSRLLGKTGLFTDRRYGKILPFLLLVFLPLTSCGDGNGPERASSDSAVDPDSWILPSSYYDTLSPNPTPLTGGMASSEELVRAGLKALQRNDTTALVELMITPEEYSAIIYPELGKHWSGARDTRETITDWMKRNHFGSAEKGLRRMLRDFGGRSFRLDSVTFGDSIQVYPSYTIHQQTLVSVTDAEGKHRDLRAFGSIVEKAGIFKLLSWRDAD